MTVRIGAEVEFLPVKENPSEDMLHSGNVERRNGTKLTLPVVRSYSARDLTVALNGQPAKWQVGTDGYNIECRTDSTECVLSDDYTDHLTTLAEYVNGPFQQVADYEQNWYTGHHLHINVREECGPAVNRLALMCRYWDFHEQYRSLVENPENRLQGKPYNALLPTDNKDVFLQRLLSHSPEFRANGLGTMELRTWDTTFDTDLIARRGAFLREFIEAVAAGVTPEDISCIARNLSADRFSPSYVFGMTSSDELTPEIIDGLYEARPELREVTNLYPCLTGTFTTYLERSNNE